MPEPIVSQNEHHALAVDDSHVWFLFASDEERPKRDAALDEIAAG